MFTKEQEELEWKTRRERIDPKLVALGWTIVRFRPDLTLASLDNCALTEYPTANGPPPRLRYMQ